MLEWIAPRGRSERVVYGLILVAALLAAESGDHETHLDQILSVAVACATFWLAHSYASLLASRMRAPERLIGTAFAHALREEAPLLRGAAIPEAVLVLGWAIGATREAAVTAALWTAIGCLVSFELLAGIAVRARPRELALDVAVGVVMGAGVIALKVLLH